MAARITILFARLILCSSVLARQNTDEQECGVEKTAESVMSSIVNFAKKPSWMATEKASKMGVDQGRVQLVLLSSILWKLMLSQ
ncbi:hypothetical protein [Microbulbifer sp. VAAF005]|uniref:hypothetical protein n=1 Tax=Microbulbifer sp. VAAF005 TaxID=3034230 RepID=UPI0024AD2C8A|nr:hypothetical protein [Microbulbifer sp. VAAF005]WHI45335.1 hypothetical protein P0078_16580 [Microbulbifer sp. VAAF005]